MRIDKAYIEEKGTSGRELRKHKNSRNTFVIAADIYDNSNPKYYKEEFLFAFIRIPRK